MTSIILPNGSNPPPKGSQPLLPEEGKRNILITSALPYCNNVPHLGTLIGCVLSADVYARYARLRGYNIIYICGTDEYGTATEQKAKVENLTPPELCQKYGQIHRETYDWFNIGFDHFGHTATPKQTEISQEIFTRLYERGLLYEKETDQLFCQECDRFLADRFVEGECPHCHHPDARGDQCDSCSKLLSPTELINPRCQQAHPSEITPIVRTSNHLYLDLPKLAPQIEQLFAEKEAQQTWTKNTCDVTRAWLKEGLKPRCITRDLKWGTPVPLDGFRDKVFYVWFDAPIGYLSITAEYTDQWRQWWQTKNETKTELYQFLGKDNIPFHTIIFPGTLIGADDDYTLLDHCSTTEYINYEGGKFSKSKGTGVFGDQVKQTGIPSYVWRYYLLSNRPEKADTVFAWNDFQVKNNAELSNNIGNLCNRGISFINRHYDQRVPSSPEEPLHLDDQELLNDLRLFQTEYIQALEQVHLKEGLKIVLKLSTRLNKYFQDSNIWVLIKEESSKERASQISYWVIQGIAQLSLLLEPFIPDFCAQLRTQLNCPVWKLNDTFTPLLEPNHQIGKPKPLVQKITNDQVIDWQKQFK